MTIALITILFIVLYGIYACMRTAGRYDESEEERQRNAFKDKQDA